ncbi:hypothetical protein PHYSODRAFT_320501 [Phytophthora sojae]|uniref:Uncharacterized protein n=1 Tax=Phytophthora sojae (strain P6497) TaxID=1094619 RepID=G4YHZ5_PHYSP|nr:hypothetical protein PHYSODRAFT_320501 [Phytophthora sojae]EGZ26582.1 hypothetical protein PHYSODRAFT_320501 [Phytophthora sojae]|eukprot:XP_009513857.1 hypothetical protein PHYSODRAFT_320501 [Phytophthora sojae]
MASPSSTPALVSTDINRKGPVRYDDWKVFQRALDSYCIQEGEHIGVEFTVSVAARNKQIMNSKKVRDGKRAADLLPESLEAYRRTYVCRRGRKRRSKQQGINPPLPRTACPFELNVKSVNHRGT